jgi:Ca-activated chloride channel family protein
MKKLLLGMILVLATMFTNVVAQDSPRAVIIFDASGSMWGQINGTPKISIARDALKNVIREWNPNVELGLTAYGHRSKGDCNDIETIIPVGRVDKNRVIQTVMGIQPKGKTPISRSLRKVANEIKYTEEKATIILISDGKETCDPDPCGTAKELEKEGIDFVTHVIGFNVDRNTDKQLECIAHATGGEYFSAKNATALNKAIKVIAKKVEKPKPVVLKPTTLELMAKYKTLGKSSLPLSGAEWKVEQNGQVLFNDKTISHPQLKIEAGKANIEMIYPHATKTQKSAGTIGIKANQNNSVVVYVDNGVVNITASETTGGSLVKGSFHVYPMIDGKVSEDESFWCTSNSTQKCERALVVGDYLVKASYNLFKVEKKFSLMSGEQKNLHIIFKPTNKIEITASETQGGKWISAIHYIYNIVDGEKEEQITNCWSEKKKSCVEQLPVGKYIMVSEYNEFKKETAIEIKAGELLKVNVVMGQTGKIEITASETEGGKWVSAIHYIHYIVDGEKECHKLKAK